MNGTIAPPDDGHAEKTGALLRARPEALARQRENGGEHDGIEQPDRQQRPGRDRSCRVGRGEQQHEHHTRVERKHLARRDEAQQIGTDESPDHGAAPIERDVLAGIDGAQAEDALLLEVEDDERADRHLGADVEKDAKHTEGEARPAQQRPRMTERRGVIVGNLREAAAARPDHRRDHQDRGREPDVNAHDEMAFLGPEYRPRPRRTAARDRRSRSIPG